ncbi:hypothetical protein HAX54_042914 [Datura stramonium]|uniref:Uncharacterized protein n=1 Tax=Datura stramonium TaxID=4076 RepID=A0ABS8W2M5_DATST|nr:hypothetical protein [Datura stramonium]
MQMDMLIGNLLTYELKKIDKIVEEPKKESNLDLKVILNLMMNKWQCSFEDLRSSSEKKILRKGSHETKAFKKPTKATWGKTSDDESEGKEVKNDNLALITRSGLDTDEESSEISLSDL